MVLTSYRPALSEIGEDTGPALLHETMARIAAEAVAKAKT
jgi:hypothetical protein